MRYVAYRNTPGDFERFLHRADLVSPICQLSSIVYNSLPKVPLIAQTFGGSPISKCVLLVYIVSLPGSSIVENDIPKLCELRSSK